MNTLNAGFDFALTRTRRITASVDYFAKRSRDLMNDSELPAYSGMTTYRGNTAALAGHGLDVNLTTINTVGPIRWETNWLYSLVKNRVTAFRIEPNNVMSLLGTVRRHGTPIDGIHALAWGGLNPVNGNPVGILNGQPSEDYTAILSSTNYNDLQYIGSLNPTHFGSIRNDLSWRNLSLSVHVMYKLGFYRRSPVILNYQSLFSGAYQTSAARFTDRWQQPGDEVTTHVPSMIYPANYNRDQFYQLAAVHTGSGSHFRLQDIRVGYRWRTLQLFAIASNIGLIWQADRKIHDPDYSFRSNRTTISGGITVTL